MAKAAVTRSIRDDHQKNFQQPVSRPQPSPGRRRENFLDDW